MRETPPAPNPEVLAQWLLTATDGVPDTLEERMMAAVQTYERLRAFLAAFLGLQGFDALWARALHLARRQFFWEDAGRPSAALPAPHHLDLAVRGRDAAEAQIVVLAVFTHFLTLLFTFIGADLSMRLLRQHWPALPTPAAHTPDEEAQP